MIKEIILKNFKCFPDACLECKNLCEIDAKPVLNKISKIEVYHWIDCNCACVYCSNRADSKLKVVDDETIKVRGVTDIVPILIKLKQMDLLDDNLLFTIVGGEITLLDEFKDLSKFIIENNYAVNIVSNGILYDPNVVELLNANPLSCIVISLDCSNKQKYIQIKGVDRFDSVVSTLRRYVAEIKNSHLQVRLKYILLEGLNDSKEEINNWIKLGVELGIKSFFPSAEFCHSGVHTFPKHICELYNYIKLEVSKLGDAYQVCVHDFLDIAIEDYLKK